MHWRDSMGCLNDINEERRAGQLAGKCLIANTYEERQKIYLSVLPHLKTRVDEMIEWYEGNNVQRLGKAIASLKTKYERNIALKDVDIKIRDKVKQFVIGCFSKRERRNANVNSGQEIK